MIRSSFAIVAAVLVAGCSPTWPTSNSAAVKPDPRLQAQYESTCEVLRQELVTLEEVEAQYQDHVERLSVRLRETHSDDAEYADRLAEAIGELPQSKALEQQRERVQQAMSKRSVAEKRMLESLRH